MRSTISSGLNSLAAVCLEDLVKLLCFKDISEKRATLASKLICAYILTGDKLYSTHCFVLAGHLLVLLYTKKEHVKYC